MSKRTTLNMKFHISTSIDGLLNLSDCELRKMLSCVADEDGNHPTLLEFKEYLFKEKTLGHKLIASQNCDNFDPVLGCLGHKEE